jgi:anti-anti-sigma factor
MDSLRARAGTPPPLVISVAVTPAIVSVQVGGELDAFTTCRLSAALSAVALDGADHVQLDLRLLKFCDCAGARLLLEFDRRARRAGKRTTIHGAKPHIQKVLRLVADGDQPTFE